MQELRFAIRMLLKQPGFSLIAALTLALGIGATSAIFSLIQGVLLTPPPYDKPAQLMLIPSARTDGKDGEPARLASGTVEQLGQAIEFAARHRRLQLDLQFPRPQ